MNYSEFTTLSKATQQLGLKQHKSLLFESPQAIAPSANLTAALEDGAKMGLFTEKAKSEFIIAPVLREVWHNANERISIFSGVPLVVESANLNGYCDFILSNNPDSYEMNTPIFCLVEAKNRALEEGLGQCAAEMYAAKLMNEQQRTAIPCVYGCVSNGYEWLFLQLKDTTLSVDTQRFYLNEIPRLLGVFQAIIAEIGGGFPTDTPAPAN